MTPAQHRAYRAEVAKWQQACKRLGRSCDDAARRALHAECNAPASSKDFTNAQLDRVLAKLRSYSDMGNLAAQLRPDAETSRRINAAQHRCHDAIEILTGCHDRHDHRQSRRRENYLEAMARRICGRAFYDLDEAGVVKLAHVLENRARKVAPATPPADPEAEFRTSEEVEF